MHKTTEHERLGTRLLILFLMGSVYFFTYVQRIGVPGTIFNEIQTEFQVSAAEVAALSAIFLYIYGGMQLLVGVLVDGFGAGRVLLTGGVLLCIGSVFFPFSQTLGLLYASRALVGLGASLVYLSIIKELAELFDEKDFPFFFSVALVLGYSGGLFSTLPLERISAFLGWRKALLAVGFTSILFLAGTGYFLIKNRRLGRIRRISFRAIGSVVRRGVPLPVLFCGGINFSIYFLVQATVGKKLLQDCAGMDSAYAASFTFWMMLTTVVFMLVFGYVARVVRRRTSVILFIPLISLVSAGLMVLNLGDSPRAWLFLVSYLLFSVTGAGSSIMFNTLVKEGASLEATGTSVGILNTVSYLMVAVLSNAAGLTLDYFKPYAVRTATAVIYPVAAYRVIFEGCFVLALIAFGLALLIREPCDGRPKGVVVLPEG